MLGHEAQDRCGARVFCSFAGTIAVMRHSLSNALVSSRICGRDVKDVAKISPSQRCPDLQGFHFLRVRSKTHHHQPSNHTRVHIQTPHRNMVQKVRPTKEPPGGH